MERSYRRRILVRRDGAGISVDLEDNFHRFGVRLQVHDHRVADASGSAGRVPWSTCPGALVALADLLGHDVRKRFTIGAESKASRHCTHLFDMAMLALDHLRLDLPGRDYRLSVTGPISDERLTLEIDGENRGHWHLANDCFMAPDAWRGQPVGRVHTLVDAQADPVAFLEIMLMRRVVRISHGRFIDQDLWDSAADLGAAPSCLSFQPEVRPTARRIRGSARDFTNAQHLLLREVSECT